jgi:hypothetical protein
VPVEFWKVAQQTAGADADVKNALSWLAMSADLIDRDPLGRLPEPLGYEGVLAGGEEVTDVLVSDALVVLGVGGSLGEHRNTCGDA